MRFAIVGWCVSVLADSSAWRMEAGKGRSSVGEGSGPSSTLGMNGDEEVPLDQVPALVVAAALKAFPTFVPESAEAEVEDGVLLYSLSGSDDEGAREIE